MWRRYKTKKKNGQEIRKQTVATTKTTGVTKTNFAAQERSKVTTRTRRGCSTATRRLDVLDAVLIQTLLLPSKREQTM